MSNLRKSFLIVVDGEEHKIMTNARDMATVGDIGALGPAVFTFRLLHEACIRLDVPNIPANFDDFLDVLDDVDDLDGVPVGVPGEDVDPTPAATSDG